MPLPSESLRLPHVPLHLVAPPPAGQARCLPLRELSLRVLASAAPGCRSLGVERCVLPCTLRSPPLPVPLPVLTARAPRLRPGSLPRLRLLVIPPSLPHLMQTSYFPVLPNRSLVTPR